MSVIKNEVLDEEIYYKLSDPLPCKKCGIDFIMCILRDMRKHGECCSECSHGRSHWDGRDLAYFRKEES